MDDTTELAWAAGFFDGEGNVSVIAHVKAYGTYLYPTIQVPQIALEPLERFKAAVGGVGYIRGPLTYPSKPNRQPLWIYQCSARRDVQLVLERLRPFVCTPKRLQIERAAAAFADIAARPPRLRVSRTVCPNGHPYTSAAPIPKGRGFLRCHVCTEARLARQLVRARELRQARKAAA